LGGRAGRAAGRLAQGGQQAAQLGPARTDQLAQGRHIQLGIKVSQRLHNRRVGQAVFADRHAPSGQHPGPIRGAAGGQLGDQAGLAHPGLAPHQDDDRLAICGPPPGRLENLEFLDTANEGRARHAAAHLAAIIDRDPPERNGQL
jgi:hypothetical protein